MQTLHIIRTSSHTNDLQDIYLNAVEVCISVFPFWELIQ
jgi:hypothetical protein